MKIQGFSPRTQNVLEQGPTIDSVWSNQPSDLFVFGVPLLMVLQASIFLKKAP